MATQAEVKVGQVWVAKVSNRLVKVLIISSHPGRREGMRTRYRCQNLLTGREVEMTAAKLRRLVGDDKATADRLAEAARKEAEADRRAKEEREMRLRRQYGIGVDVTAGARNEAAPVAPVAPRDSTPAPTPASGAMGLPGALGGTPAPAPRVYTVDRGDSALGGCKVTYTGIARLKRPAQVEASEVPFSWERPMGPSRITPILALAWFDGEPDLWVLDSQEAVGQLRQYYIDEGWSPDRVEVQLFIGHTHA